MLSEKYIAGFLDSDGCICLKWDKRREHPSMQIEFSQKSSRDAVLFLIRDAIGGSIRIVARKGGEYTSLTLSGKKAKMALQRMKKYLVLKKEYAERVDEVLCMKNIVCRDSEKAALAAARKTQARPMNFPPRKWLAGYFDGDGCVSVHSIGKSGQAHIRAHIVASGYDSHGLRLIQKAFGGQIYKRGNNNCVEWFLHLCPSKAIHFFSYFSKHSIVKKSQIDFILGCAQVGHYRDGIGIKSKLKQLKAQEHRLSDSGGDVCPMRQSGAQTC